MHGGLLCCWHLGHACAGRNRGLGTKMQLGHARATGQQLVLGHARLGLEAALLLLGWLAVGSDCCGPALRPKLGLGP